MCRHLAYLGDPVALDQLLLDPTFSLLKQSYAPRKQRYGLVNADGFGIGWYVPEIRREPARYRSAKPIWADQNLPSFAGVVRSGCIVASVRDATPGAPIEESGAAPFLSGPWLFAHNGAVDGWREGVGEKVRSSLNPDTAARIVGSSDSEVLFGVVLDELRTGAGLVEGLAAAIGTVTAISDGRLNFLLSDGNRIAASSWGDTLYVGTLETGTGSGTVLASEPFDESTNWLEVPDARIVESGPLGTTTHTIDR